jgi:DNA helicase-2/ATP-dependent DNA helicase PcrA
MQKNDFETAYNRLNPEQKKAVDTTEGPVMVIAGPGTGKTQILTLRIANILRQTDVSPENILALTFTESGARAMRERLAEYIGAPAYRVHIHTFHEFAGHCIRKYPDAYTRALGGRPISDLEKITLIESILDTPQLASLRPRGNPQFYVKPIMSALSLMKREYITPGAFALIIEEQQKVLDATPKIHEKGAHKGKVRSEYIDRDKGVAKNKELLFVYRAYESALKEQRYVDYDDMIFETVNALVSDENMLRSLQEQYQYILADEHQDVNGSQNKILEVLSSFHDRPNIFVVGDEKQSIYRFQGASLENFLYFEEKFPHTTTIALTANYRSAQEILDFAHELITVEAGPASALRVPLIAKRKEFAGIEKRVFSHEAVEHEYVVKAIEELISQGVPEDEIAIIVRTNREVDELTAMLRGNGVSAESSSDSDILAHPITTSVRTLIRAVCSPSDEKALFEVLHSGYVGIRSVDLVRIFSARSYAESLTSIVHNRERLSALGVVDLEQVHKIIEVLKEARNRMDMEAPHRVLEYVIRESGFLEFAISSDPYEGARVIRRLYDEVEETVRHEKVVTLRDVEVMFTTCMEHGIALNAPYIHTGRHAVQVMTAHKAKGLEFLHVFIPHLTDQKWGGRARAEYFAIPITRHINESEFDALDDERKILYVVLTRAKEGLYLSSAKTNTEGRALLGTSLLEGVGDAVIVYKDTEPYETAFNPTTELEAKDVIPDVDIAFLRKTLHDRGLSATALNNYLRDPWNYFYRNVLRIPEVQPENAQFGTALHNTLEHVFKYRTDHKTFPEPTLIKQFLERELGKLSITHNEFVRHHERGFEVLLTYIAHIEKSAPPETKEEFSIQATLTTGDNDFPEILLTGKLDRLDFDGEGMLVRVVDYKTGKPRTRGYIEGTTKDSTGDYKRQLTFYALLLSLYGDERYDCKNGALSFIEADDKGVIHEEAYTITDDEISLLKGEIIRVALEIAHGAFLNTPCDPEKSDYCLLAAEFQKRI